MNNHPLTTAEPSVAANGGEPFIKKRDVAKRLGKTVRTVDNWMSRGILPYYKIGRSIEFKWSEIEAHLAQTCRVTRGG
jgi:excisionase family DNA binding protein